MADTQPLAPCGECGMPCAANEYHPYAACLMFKACHNSEVVRANLEAVHGKPVPASAAEFALRVLVLPGAPVLPVVPAGYALVPVEPTPEMLAEVDEEVGGHCYSCTRWKASHDDCQRIWVAMLAAAPQPVVREPRYRLLEPGIDRIEADDEFLMDDTQTWETDAGGIFVGALYGCALRPARRAVERAHGITTNGRKDGT